MGTHLRFCGCIALAGLTLVFLLACSERAPEEDDRPAMTQRQRDSTIAESILPGASTVGRALEVADSAAARAARPLPDSP
jgi:hypothetical protein